MRPTLLEQQTFTAYGERTARVIEEVLSRVPESGPFTLLEIGCGTGAVLRAVADARADARLTGVDLSSANVAAAREAVAVHDGRVEVVAGDYLGAPVEGPFDLVLADQSLHLIGGDTEALCDRLAAHVRPGGLLVAEMPYASPYNAALVGARRALRRLRGPLLDRVAFGVARRLHSGGMPEAQLRERLEYLYVVPPRLGGRRWEAALAARGFARIERIAMRLASPAQLQHDLRVYRR